MTPENLSRTESEAAAGRELTDAELEAIAAGKDFLTKLNSGIDSPIRGNNWGGGFGGRALPGRGGRFASNVANTGKDYA